MSYKRYIRNTTATLICATIGLAVVIAIEIMVALHGPHLPLFVNPDHTPRQFGKQGSRLIYLVIGDSTGAGQGAPYEEGIAVQSARHLALSHQVTMYNFSISGAVTNDVLRDQLPQTARLEPDIVLVLIGSNDVTHRTTPRDLQRQLGEVLTHFAVMPKPPKVIVSGAGDLGACPRFAQPLRWIVGLQTVKVNKLMRGVTLQHGAAWADIAAKTGPSFRSDPTLFYVDGFHPNSRGYAVWTEVIDNSLDSIKA